MQALSGFIYEEYNSTTVIYAASSRSPKPPQPPGVRLHSPPNEALIFLDTLLQAAHTLPPPLQIIFDDNIHVTSEKKAISGLHATLAGPVIDVIET